MPPGIDTIRPAIDTLEGWEAQRARAKHAPRLELLLKLGFPGRCRSDACEKQVRCHREACERDAARLSGIESALRNAPNRHLDQSSWMITLRYGRTLREAERAWCDEMPEQLRNMREADERSSGSAANG